MIGISFCTIAFQRNKWCADRVVERHPREVLPLLAEAGYDAAELWGPHVLDLPEGDLDELAALLRAEGLSAAMISPYFDFTTSEETAGRSLDRGRETLEAARRLGARGVRCFTGRVGSAEATDEQWGRAVASLRTLADAAAADGIFLGCETHRGNLTDTIDASAELIDRVGRPNVGLIFQPGTFGDDYLRALERLGPIARHVHAGNGSVGLAAGRMDYAAIVAGLRDAGFDGYISVEWMGQTPVDVARREAAYLRGVLGRV